MNSHVMKRVHDHEPDMTLRSLTKRSERNWQSSFRPLKGFLDIFNPKCILRFLVKFRVRALENQKKYNKNPHNE